MKKRKKKIYAVVLAVSAVTIIYFGFVLFFTKHYFFNTIINETVINPPAELGRLTDAGGGEQSIKIENSAV